MILILELKGMNVSIEKIELLPGKKSKTVVGKIRRITLTENITTGYPVMKRSFSRHRDEAARSIPATSTVVEVMSFDEENGLYKIKTETSIYKIKK
jgi:branched-subunit amino acid aminotransferase/4-amino-4-deoxychorismate lyase